MVSIGTFTVTSAVNNLIVNGTLTNTQSSPSADQTFSVVFDTASTPDNTSVVVKFVYGSGNEALVSTVRIK